MLCWSRFCNVLVHKTHRKINSKKINFYNINGSSFFAYILRRICLFDVTMVVYKLCPFRFVSIDSFFVSMKYFGLWSPFAQNFPMLWELRGVSSTYLWFFKTFIYRDFNLREALSEPIRLRALPLYYLNSLNPHFQFWKDFRTAFH